MAEEVGQSSAFPPPPKEFELFTDENVSAYKVDPSSVPDHVARVMKAPDLPTQPYSIFGETWPIVERLPTLKDAGIEQLYPEDNSLVANLTALSRSLMLNYLELVTIMSSAPEQFPPKVEHIRLILVNMHHLINSYRPHQTRESLIAIMEKQIETRAKEVRDVQAATLQAERILQRFRVLEDHKEILTSATAQTNGHDSVMVDVHAEDEDRCDKNRDLFLFEQLASIT